VIRWLWRLWREASVQPTAPDAQSTVVSAAPIFAPTPYARARLLRQMHASGLLSDGEPQQAKRFLEIVQ
jgi:hypothetical protein